MWKDKKSSNSTLRKLVVRFCIGLTITLGLIGLDFIQLWTYVSRSDSLVSLANDTMRLRAETMRVIVLADEYHKERYRDPAIHTDFTQHLETLHEQHDRLHNAILQHPSLAQQINHQSPLYKVDTMMDNFYVLASDLMETSGPHSLDVLTKLRTLATTRMVQEFTSLSEDIDALSTEHLTTVSQSTRLTLSLTFFLILLQSLILFWTSHRSIRKTLTELSNRNDHLATARHSLEEQNLELQEAYRRIRSDALKDPLTGLSNRRHLDQEIGHLLDSSTASNVQVALLHLDLDRFKEINDTLGHAAGDHVLNITADILKVSAGSPEVIARIGGDEFTIMMVGELKRHHLLDVANRILARLAQPFDFEGLSLRSRASIGITLTTIGHMRAAHNVDHIMVEADLALYRAKQTGGDRVCFFDDNIRLAFEDRKRTLDEVSQAIHNKEFIAYYQPQFDAKTRTITGAEALARWQHPQKGVLAPHAFLDALTELNEVHLLDELILQNVLQDYKAWICQAPQVARLAVNVSAGSLKLGSMLPYLNEETAPADVITFELNESTNLEAGSEAYLATITRIQEAGYELEIDDFGTHNASLLALMTIKPKRVKIARELIQPMLESKEQQLLVQTIIDLSKSWSIDVIAEGVETERHINLLTEMGCDIFQGFAFAKPLSRTDFAAMLALDHLASLPVHSAKIGAPKRLENRALGPAA